jgi:transposase-like protein
MAGIKKTYSAEFKNKAALELIREVDTISQICSKYAIHPTQASQWKQQALQCIAQGFVGKPEVSLKEKETLIDELYKQIGQLKVEVDWLKKKM